MCLKIFKFLGLIDKVTANTKEQQLWIHIGEDLEKMKIESAQKSQTIAVLESSVQKLKDDLKNQNQRIGVLEAELETAETKRKTLDDILQKAIKAYNIQASPKAKRQRNQ
jgi:septal ring factor EnvC (AmiA/AmiB activator)